MVASRCCFRLSLGLLLACRSASAAPRTETQLVALLQGKLAGGHEPAPPQPDSRRTGSESALRIATALDEPGVWSRVRATALLKLELPLAQLEEEVSLRLRDVGSYVGVAWEGEGTTLSLRAYPFDTDYLRLGRLSSLTWGGTDTARGESIFVDQLGGVPGAELALELGAARVFAASKWTRQPESRRWGWLFGGTFHPRAWLRLDAGFGYFQRAPGAPGLPPSFVEGASARLVLVGGVLEPELAQEPFRASSLRSEAQAFEAPAPQGTALALEGVAVVQRVRRAGSAARFALSPAPGAGLYGSSRGRSVAGHAAVTWRSPELLLLGSHGLIAGEGLPAGAREAELATWLGLSGELTALSLVPSLQLAVRLPGAVRLPTAAPGITQTLLVSAEGQVVPLPLGADRLPVVNVRLGARFRASKSVSLSLVVDYERDSNRIGWTSTARGPARSFVDPDALTMTVACSARF